MDYPIYDPLEADYVPPEVQEHYEKTTHRKYHEKPYSPKGYVTAHTRIILQCVECGIIIDNNWREGMEP